ncbi:Nucleolar protein 12 [Malassezia vespertilionis]|uniref:Nucleolar protein 12 n=1 Tax=Malassezia vespertilionis TaxID=2020962 RepID=A0A2N1JE26_9BASI|nr:Nucleolar protein 12 [Malassezia vespertilionis]PKI84798.1 hypothetical protein MVES_000824 [Malassezia vespertilionis]WFD05546.1 Nucleolar protein 12 [Malassezia vespertilionis]
MPRKDKASNGANLFSVPAAGFDTELAAIFSTASAPPPAVTSTPKASNAQLPVTDAVLQAKAVVDEEPEALSSDEEWDDETRPKDDASKPKPAHKKTAVLEGADDTDMDKGQRTIFLGNVPVAIVKSRAVRKQFTRYIESMSPYPEYTCIVSLRFRSLSFSVPTNDFSAPDQDAANAASRRRERARKFRELNDTGPKEGTTDKPLLTGQQKRKIAYINQDLNERATMANAYIRLGKPDLVYEQYGKHRADVPPFDSRITGAVLAALLAAALDNGVFEGRHLRADVVMPLAPHEIINAGLDKILLPDGSRLASRGTGTFDPKCTVFVGNIDFEAGEEDLRGLFERILREERGEPPAKHAVMRLDGNASGAQMPGEWVQSVRIVRDKATQLGKGFAYVKFIDPLCVDEVVALHDAEEAFIEAARPKAPGKKTAKPAKPIALQEGQEFRRRIKLNKRALRIARCKQVAVDTRRRKRDGPSQPRTAPPAKRNTARVRSTGAPTPNGTSPTLKRTADGPRVDPAFLATLDKGQRKELKKNDAQRQARRMDKKQSNNAAKKVANAVGTGRERVKLPQRSASKKMAGVKKA